MVKISEKIASTYLLLCPREMIFYASMASVSGYICSPALHGERKWWHYVICVSDYQVFFDRSKNVVYAWTWMLDIQ
jgi:hypothetical protein